jgi:hypothetical protein
LELVATPLQTRYSKKMNACFDLNNPDFKQPFAFDNAETRG